MKFEYFCGYTQDWGYLANVELMDSPLNRAHQQERKAEKLSCWKNYKEAVTCYDIAAGYVTEAMKTTTASQALISMQLQYEDHLRKKRLLQFKIQSQALKDMKSDNYKETNDNQETSCEVLQTERSDSSFDLSLLPSEGVQAQENDVNFKDKTVCQTTIEDLHMQILSLTQALEDTNRENNHLRNIVIRFKEVLHEKFGFSNEEIEAMLVSEEDEQTTNLVTDYEETQSACEQIKQNSSKLYHRNDVFSN